MAKIALDMDGVLANFTLAFIDQVNSVWPGRLSRDYVPTDWDWTNSGLTKADLNKVWKSIKKVENFWLRLDAHSENVGALASWMIEQRDHDVWLCTARAVTAGMTTAKQTEMWIRTCNVQPINNFLGIITVDDGDKKAQLYEAAGIKWSLDDKGETVQDCALIDTFEHHAYVLDRPWNQTFGIHNRVGSVADFLKRIK